MIRSIRHVRLRSALILGVAVPLVYTGCDRPRAIGDQTQIIVGARQSAWDALEDDLKEALEPRTFTVRDERVFDIAHADPGQPGWESLRVQRQVLLIGQPDEPAIAQAVDRYRGTPPPPPGVFQVRNVWAQNQTVTVAVLPPGEAPTAARPLLPTIGQAYLQQFEENARSRMFVSGANEELANTLRKLGGFSLLLPNVYRSEEVEPGVFVFRNDQPDPASLIRNITVTSRPRGEVRLEPQVASDWRSELAARLNTPPQVTEALAESHEVQVAGRSGIQIQGIWSNPPGQWPAAGPFLTRLVPCDDRVFLVDAWLYAPRYPKYEYMFQLKTILDSFAC
jgi:hypothetical protein